MSYHHRNTASKIALEISWPMNSKALPILSPIPANSSPSQSNTVYHRPFVKKNSAALRDAISVEDKKAAASQRKALSITPSPLPVRAKSAGVIIFYLTENEQFPVK